VLLFISKQNFILIIIS